MVGQEAMEKYSHCSYYLAGFLQTRTPLSHLLMYTQLMKKHLSWITFSSYKFSVSLCDSHK